jgi:tRNA1Val (adenine37-N6)-methyltransferase
MSVMSGETLDQLAAFGLVLKQPQKGYRFSVDPLLLCGFADTGEVVAIADLGTGCGVIPLIMARRCHAARIVGVEFQQQMAALARLNVAENGVADRVTVVEVDVLHCKGRLPHAGFDLVMANPPFRRQGSGRVSPREGRDAARHESTATLEDFLATAKYLVRPGGRIAFVHLAARLGEFLATAASLRLVPLRLQLVHGTGEADAKMFLCELTRGRGGELTVLPPLFLWEKEGVYTSRALAMMGLATEEGGATP